MSRVGAPRPAAGRAHIRIACRGLGLFYNMALFILNKIYIWAIKFGNPTRRDEKANVTNTLFARGSFCQKCCSINLKFLVDLQTPYFKIQLSSPFR